MAFIPRSFDEILADMVAFVQANTTVSDFTPGSVIRTILEAAATEDDEQYYQMVQLLDMYSYTTAVGDDLDRRLADFNVVREKAQASTTRVRFFNQNIISSQAALDVPALSTALRVFNATSFPTPAPTYVIRVGEGTARVQDVTVSALNYSTGTFTLSTPLIFNVEVGDRVSFVSTANYTIPAGQSISSPATIAEAAKTFSTQEPAFILAGNYFSNEVVAKSLIVGEISNVGVRRITQFQGAQPFPGAGVTNTAPATGGRNRENDAAFRSRAVRQIQSLSRGTPLALINGALGVQDLTTGQRVISANIIEDFEREEVTVYIDDGTGFTPTVVSLPSDTLSANALTGSNVLSVNSVFGFPSSGQIILLGVNTDVVGYSSIDTVANTITLSSPLTQDHFTGDLVFLVDVISTSVESGQRRFRTRNAPVVRSTPRLWVNNGSGWAEYLEGVSFIMNRGTGELQLGSSIVLTGGASIVATYSYYTNLIAEVQRVLEGQLGNPGVYPGYKAAGIFLSVEAPNLRRVTVRAVITAADGYTEADLRDAVRNNIESYINSSGIGSNIIRSKLIDVAFNVPGVKDVTITTPTANVTILENELPVAYDSNGNTLVTVS